MMDNKEKDLRKPRKRWFYGAATTAAAVALIVTVKSVVKTKVIGDDTVAGRTATVMEVTPQGGSPYKIWVDKETKMPLQKQSTMEYSLQYKVHYANIDFTEAVPKELSSANEQAADKPQVEVTVDLQAEQEDQRNADAGHSLWKLDPVFVSQVFVSLKISPKGTQGDYPVKYEELNLLKNTGKEAVVEVGGNKTPIGRVYLKRLIRQDNTEIWAVVGYDPINNR